MSPRAFCATINLALKTYPITMYFLLSVEVHGEISNFSSLDTVLKIIIITGPLYSD